MDSAKPPSLRSRFLQMFAALAVALLLYVFSVGPAFYLIILTSAKSEAWGTFYTPALVVLQLAKPGLANAYVGWWGELARRHMGHPGS